MSFPVGYLKYKKYGFKTPPGKIELYPKTLENLGYKPLPSYQDPLEGNFKEEILKKYPLILMGHRDVHYMHSEFRQIPSIRKRYQEPLIEINPDTEKDLRIQDGETI